MFKGQTADEMKTLLHTQPNIRFNRRAERLQNNPKVRLLEYSGVADATVALKLRYRMHKLEHWIVFILRFHIRFHIMYLWQSGFISY